MFISRKLRGMFDPATGDNILDWLETQFIAAGWTINKKVTVDTAVTDMTDITNRWVESSVRAPQVYEPFGSDIHMVSTLPTGDVVYFDRQGYYTYTFESPQVITSVQTNDNGGSNTYKMGEVVGLTRDLEAGYEILHTGSNINTLNVVTGRSYDGLMVRTTTTGFRSLWTKILVNSYNSSNTTELYVQSPSGNYFSFVLDDFFQTLVVYSNSGFNTLNAVDAQPGVITGVGGIVKATIARTQLDYWDMSLYIDTSYFTFVSTNSYTTSGSAVSSTTSYISGGDILKYGTYTGGRYLSCTAVTAIEYENSWYCTNENLADQLGLGLNITDSTLATNTRNHSTQSVRIQPVRLFIDTSLTATPNWGAVGEIPKLFTAKKGQTHGGTLIQGADTYDVFTSGGYNATDNIIVQTN